MDLYPLLIFLHVLGAVGLFAALGIEVVALGRFRSASTPDAARVWLGLLATPLPLISMLMILVTGIWMSIARWGDQAWIAASFLAVLGMVAIATISMRRLRRVGVALAPERGPELSAAFRVLQSGAALVASLWLRAAIGIGILALMTLKPGALGSIAILGGATAAGMLGSLLGSWRRGIAAGASEGRRRVA